MVKYVAKRLGSLRDRVAFVGGSATGLLITDAAAPEVRPTRDVDIIVEIASRVEYHRLEETLRELGFTQSIAEETPICRWEVGDVAVDVMPTNEEILGFSNRWYHAAIKTSTMLVLEPGLSIRLVRAPHFIATKLEAFNGRGRGDFVASRDLEDIVSVVDGRPELLGEITASPEDLRRFLADAFGRLLKTRALLDAIPNHLPPDAASQARVPLIMARMEKIAGGAGN